MERGEVGLRIGTTAGDDDVFPQAALRTGMHSIAFTPGAGTVYVEFFSTLSYPVLVDSVELEGAGTVELPTIWDSAAACRLVRAEQVNDVVFCACDGYRPQRIERRVNNSWSVVDYEPGDGPFPAALNEAVTLTPSALSGQITLTASQPLFSEGDVGVLYRLVSAGQIVQKSISAEDTWSNPIKVTGVGTNSRDFDITVSGTWSGTVRLQRSLGDVGAWTNRIAYTSNTTATYQDGLDNQIAYYRIGIDAGDYTSGTAEVQLEYSAGSITGVVRIIGFTSPTEVDAIVLTDLGSTEATRVWARGDWGGAAGYPTATGLHEGRLYWAGRGRNWASIADAYDSFDPDYEGDAGPINRGLGKSGVDVVNWMLPLDRLLVGADSAEHSIRSSSLDEPVTPSNYNVREASTLGSAPIPAVRYDRRGVFVDRSGKRLYEMAFASNGYDYEPTDMTALDPDVGEAGFVRVAVQRQPDTRIHCVRADGTVAVLVRDPVEDVVGWIDVETAGEVEDVYILPGTTEDQVFYTVKRTIDGATVRYHERWAQENECRGGSMNKLADSFIAVSRTASTSVTGLDHLEGEEVIIWADGAEAEAATVSGGAITLATAAADVCVGLAYTATYKSSKPHVVSREMGSSMSRRGRIVGGALILADVHPRGLEFGQDFDTMDNLPVFEDGAAVDADAVRTAYAEERIPFPGDWGNDTRLCLRATAPRPVTVLAALVDIDWQN